MSTTRSQDVPTIHLCVRKTLDWHDEALVHARINPFFRQKFEMWNATFAMPYHVFRQRLKALSERSLHAAKGAVISDLAAVPDGDIIVPIDDDDWFAPDVAEQIRQHLRPGATGILWKPVTIELAGPWIAIKRRLARLRRRRWRPFVCSSNNYAVLYDRSMTELALNHLVASKYVETHPSEFVRIDGRLAVQNRSLASQTALALRRRRIERPELVRLFHGHRVMYKKWKPEKSLEWATPYVEEMDTLMSELTLK